MALTKPNSVYIHFSVKEFGNVHNLKSNTYQLSCEFSEAHVSKQN